MLKSSCGYDGGNAGEPVRTGEGAGMGGADGMGGLGLGGAGLGGAAGAEGRGKQIKFLIAPSALCVRMAPMLCICFAHSRQKSMSHAAHSITATAFSHSRHVLKATTLSCRANEPFRWRCRKHTAQYTSSHVTQSSDALPSQLLHVAGGCAKNACVCEA